MSRYNKIEKCPVLDVRNINDVSIYSYAYITLSQNIFHPQDSEIFQCNIYLYLILAGQYIDRHIFLCYQNIKIFVKVRNEIEFSS